MAICRAFIVRAEASEGLKDALLAEQPGFKGFSKTALSRLPVLLNAVAEDSELSIITLQDMEPITVIVLGLCLSTKKIRRMSAELWTDHCRQAEDIGKRLRALVFTHSRIDQAIKESKNEEFKQSFSRELQLGTLASVETVMTNEEWYHYKVSRASRLPRLAALATNEAVSVYVPQTSGDCSLRLVTPFDASLVKDLFGFAMESYGVDECVLRSPLRNIC
ncbi:hypothetical protein QQX98_007021 [Neonectria punicea]|uniref:Uncharacterized protein n=1 Tax=Neonectria punicea TaxID=979145 RepID=A0ABR1GZG0_9HYPO